MLLRQTYLSEGRQRAPRPFDRQHHARRVLAYPAKDAGSRRRESRRSAACCDSEI